MAFPARAPTWHVQWSIGVASPCFVLVSWNLIHVPLRLDLEEEEFLCVDIAAEIEAKHRRTRDDSSLILAHGLQFVVEAATRYLEESFGFDELSIVAAGTLILDTSFADSILHLCILWRLHKFWLFAVPLKSGTPVDLKHALVAAGSRVNAGDHGLPFWNMDEFESPPSVDFDPDIPSQETVGACLLVLTHEPLENIIPVDLETPTYCSLDDMCVLNSAGMIFRLD